MSTSKPLILLFTQDLRLRDNPAFAAAVRSKQAVLPCYILDSDAPGIWRKGSASRWWLHHSLASLDEQLVKLGTRLVLRRGSLEEELPKLVAETGATQVYWSRMYAPYAQQLEQRLYEILHAQKVAANRCRGYLLFEPEQICTGDGQPFKVFTPFWRACLRQPAPQPPQAKPREMVFYSGSLKSEQLAAWELLPRQPDWAGGLRAHWKPGEMGAQEQLRRFLRTGLSAYAMSRDVPAAPHTSRLSPYLHWGEISPRQCWHAVTDALAKNPEWHEDVRRFLSQLGWREFSYHLLHHWPELPTRAFRKNFEDFPWCHDSEHLTAWQSGRTGVPLVDAGMRELWHTGWMHNRVRMVAASFLVKNLLIHWQYGETWFWDTLVDADLANNAAGWQWVAGSGADAAPYFRIFNPALQAEKFDPEGTYIRQWVPELRALTGKHLYQPWSAPTDILSAANVRLGENYPYPLVDLASTRKRALDAYKAIK